MNPNFEQVIPLVSGVGILSLVKAFFLFALALYIIFAAVVVRQIHLMMRTIEGILEGPLNLLVYLHLSLAIFVFFAALVIL